MLTGVSRGFTPTLKKHGNSKVEKPFHPTWLSTKQQIKKMCIDYGPAETVCSITTEAGGIVQATAPGQLPRDEKQVTNFKKKVSLQSKPSNADAAANSLFSVMQQAYSDDPSHRFVQAVKGVTSPTLSDLIYHQKVSLHLYNERFHNGSAEIFAQLL